MEEKGINKNILSAESGVPYTTIDGFYKKGYKNTKLSTLRKLSDYFGVSLDYLIGNSDSSLTHKNYEDAGLKDDEKDLVGMYNLLNQDGKVEAHKQVENLTYIPKYQVKESYPDYGDLLAAHADDPEEDISEDIEKFKKEIEKRNNKKK